MSINPYWDSIKGEQKFEEIELVDPDSPKPEGHTRFVCVSDTHSRQSTIPYMPPGDVLLHAGDFSNVGLETDIKYFNQWLKDLTCYQHKVVIAGNHDLTFDTENYMPVCSTVYNLHS